MKYMTYKILFDVREIDDLSLESNQYKEYSSIRFITNYRAYHPQNPSPLWQGRIDVLINGQGFHTRGKMEFLMDTWISIAYPGMLAIDKTNTDNDRVVSSYGNRYNLPKNINDNSNVIIQGVPSSVAHFTQDSASQSAKNIVIAIELDNIKRSLRLGEKGTPKDPVMTRLR